MEQKTLIDIIAEQNQKSKKEAKEIIRMVIEGMKTAFKENIEVRFSGFGIFKPHIRKGKKWAINGHEGVSPDVKTVSFGLYKSFKEELNPAV